MKKICEIGLFVLVGLVLLSSCSMDDSEYDYSPEEPGPDVFINSYGLVIEDEYYDSGSHSILRDDGALLVIKSNLLSYDTQLYTGQRIFFNYRLTGGRDDAPWSGKIYDITLYAIDEIASKQPVTATAIQNEVVDNNILGYDPVTMRAAWFGGKFLNVIVETLRKKDSVVEHALNLVHDDIEIRSDSVFVSLRHNAFGDTPGEDSLTGYESVQQTMSFDVSSVLPEGQSSIIVRFTWTEYGNPPYLGFEKWGDAEFTLNFDCPIIDSRSVGQI